MEKDVWRWGKLELSLALRNGKTRKKGDERVMRAPGEEKDLTTGCS